MAPLGLADLKVLCDEDPKLAARADVLCVTAAPTRTPTARPTSQPTELTQPPTARPSAKPTRPPSEEPSVTPTHKTTGQPSSKHAGKEKTSAPSGWASEWSVDGHKWSGKRLARKWGCEGCRCVQGPMRHWNCCNDANMTDCYGEKEWKDKTGCHKFCKTEATKTVRLTMSGGRTVKKVEHVSSPVSQHDVDQFLKQLKNGFTDEATHPPKTETA